MNDGRTLSIDIKGFTACRKPITCLVTNKQTRDFRLTTQLVYIDRYKAISFWNNVVKKFPEKKLQNLRRNAYKLFVTKYI